VAWELQIATSKNWEKSGRTAVMSGYVFGDLSTLEYCRLHTLNNQLEKAEQWICRRSRDMVTAYSLAVAQARHADDGRLNEDMNLVATMLFLMREDDSAFRQGQHNIVARIDIPILPAPSTEQNALYPELSTVSNSAQRRGDWNPLLLNLYERVLQRDTAKLFSIGALCIDVALIEQQLRSW
jgi:hypothetical protein